MTICFTHCSFFSNLFNELYHHHYNNEKTTGVAVSGGMPPHSPVNGVDCHMSSNQGSFMILDLTSGRSFSQFVPNVVVR